MAFQFLFIHSHYLNWSLVLCPFFPTQSLLHSSRVVTTTVFCFFPFCWVFISPHSFMYTAVDWNYGCFSCYATHHFPLFYVFEVESIPHFMRILTAHTFGLSLLTHPVMLWLVCWTEAGRDPDSSPDWPVKVSAWAWTNHSLLAWFLSPWKEGGGKEIRVLLWAEVEFPHTCQLRLSWQDEILQWQILKPNETLSSSCQQDK